MKSTDNEPDRRMSLEKAEIDHVEDRASPDGKGDDDRLLMTDVQSRAICRKIDKVILPLLMWVYFLQILDKSVIGYGAVLGMREETHLIGDQYSLVGSVGYWAQLGWQPFSAYLIVRVPTKYLAAFLVTAWGCAMCGLAASTNYQSLMACRFLLGLFEAGCLPLFTIITTTWYRRSEQPLRIALWYGTNGVASMLGSLLAWALSFINGSLNTYQILFLTVGLATVLTGPLILWKLDNNPATASFLTEEERVMAVERLRANQTGAGTNKVNWKQVPETLYSPLTWMYIALTFAINVGASVTTVFGPIIISGFGFSSRTTLILGIPFGFLQTIVIFFACLLATRFRNKSVIMASLTVPCIVGTSILYSLDRSKKNQGPNLFSYYLLAFLYGANPIIVSWMAANIGGHTKKALTMSLYNGASSTGNIVGPLLFKAVDKPLYHPGLRAVMGIFVSGAGATGILVGLLFFFNRRKERQRVALGKPAKLKDLSMDAKYTAGENADEAGTLEDITDMKNPFFQYVY